MSLSTGETYAKVSFTNGIEYIDINDPYQEQ